MPEMPEVETLARKLRKAVTGKRVSEVRLSGLPLRKPIAPGFGTILTKRTIRRILRRGKYLIIEMEPKAYWVIHLGMTGKLLYRQAAGELSIHTHAVVRFSDATELQYRDHRRFGLMAAYEVPSLSQVPEIGALGKDPLSPGFDGKWLLPQLQKSRQEIKAFLLDQRRIAGLGNIYACESLFLAQIHPCRRCFTLNSAEANHLAGAIKKVLKVAVRHKGTTFADFMDSDGNPGENQNYLMIFQREGEDCVRCGETVRRFRQGNRSSFYCSNCQG